MSEEEKPVEVVVPKPKRKLRLQVFELKARLLTWVARGRTIRAFSRQDGMPCNKTIWEWLRKDLTFADELRDAKILGYDAMAQHCIQIADQATPENVQVAKLRIHTRLQLLARWDSGRYGDRLTLAGDQNDPIRIMSDAEAMTEIMGILATAKTRQMNQLEDIDSLKRAD